jgi:hypothetical protein
MKRSLFATMLVLLRAAVAVAQTSYTPRAEVFGDYTYMQFNPTITGLQSRALNGGGGGFQFNIGNYFGLKGEFQGYGSTQWTQNVVSPIPTPNGIIPIGTYKTNANMFTYLFGPVIRFPVKRATPFAEVLFGGSNTNLYGNLSNVIIEGGGTINKSATQHPFTMALGGGIDLNANKHVAFRLAELDYVLTRYTNPITNTNNQNNFRYVGGIVFRFGGEKAPPPPPPAPRTKSCPGGTTVPIDQECPKRDLGLGLRPDKTDVCPGGTIRVTPAAAAIPDGATLNWTVNGEQTSQAQTLEFGTTGRSAGSYRIGLKVSAPGYNDASAETSVTVQGHTPPTGTVQASPSEIWAGEKSTLSANFTAGQCGGTLSPAQFAASEGTISGNQFDSSSVQFDPSSTSEQRKTVTIAANVSDGTASGTANTSVVVKKKATATAKRLPDIIFPAGNARVNNCGKRVLLETLKTMTSGDPTAKVVFVGHEGKGEAKKSGLDQKRALNAAAVISAGKGICSSFPASQIDVSAVGTEDNGVDYQPNFCGASAGQERPGQAVKESEASKARRVEVWFVPTGAQVPASVRDAKDAASLSVSRLGCPR